MEYLMMKLFSIIADQVRNRQELFDDEARIVQSILDSGYPLHEADAALTLMQALVEKQGQKFSVPNTVLENATGVRTMSSEERRRFTMDAFAFALKLTHLGVLSKNQREELLEKAMSLYVDRIEFEHIKILTAMMLFNASSRESTLLQISERPLIKDSAWN